MKSDCAGVQHNSYATALQAKRVQRWPPCCRYALAGGTKDASTQVAACQMRSTPSKVAKQLTRDMGGRFRRN